MVEAGALEAGRVGMKNSSRRGRRMKSSSAMTKTVVANDAMRRGSR